jgi:hypothetical protein
MSEAFCRRQQTLLPAVPRPPPGPLAANGPAQLTAFWAEMGDRARGTRPRAAATDRSRARSL